MFRFFEKVAGVEELVTLEPNDVWMAVNPEAVGDLIHDAYIDPALFVLTGGRASVVGELTGGSGLRVYRFELSVRMHAEELHVVDLEQIGVCCIQDVVIVADTLRFVWVTGATATIAPLPEVVEVRVGSQPLAVRKWIRWRSL